MTDIDKQILKYYVTDSQSENHIRFLLSYAYSPDYIHDVIRNYIINLQYAVNSPNKHHIENFDIICDTYKVVVV